MWTLHKEITLTSPNEDIRQMKKEMTKHEMGILIAKHIVGRGTHHVEITEKSVDMGDKFINQTETYTIMATLETEKEIRKRGSIDKPEMGDMGIYKKETELPIKTTKTLYEPDGGQIGMELEHEEE